jgi:anti-sigma regulatory factor (Ser/Thr protein kinase)
MKTHARIVVVPGTLGSLGPIREFVKEAAAEAGLDSKRTYRLQLAVDEISSNIVIHGYEEHGLTGDVEVRAEIGPDSLTITLIDSAVAYNPLNRPQPEDLDAPLENRMIGGLGVYLAIKNVDEFLYRYLDGCNHNLFVVKLPAVQEPAVSIEG